MGPISPPKSAIEISAKRNPPNYDCDFCQKQDKTLQISIHPPLCNYWFQRGRVNTLSGGLEIIAGPWTTWRSSCPWNYAILSGGTSLISPKIHIFQGVITRTWALFHYTGSRYCGRFGRAWTHLKTGCCILLVYFISSPVLNLSIMAAWPSGWSDWKHLTLATFSDLSLNGLQ